MDTIVEISTNAKGILALIEAADAEQKEMDKLCEQIRELESQYDQRLKIRDAMHTKAKALYHLK